MIVITYSWRKTKQENRNPARRALVIKTQTVDPENMVIRNIVPY